LFINAGWGGPTGMTQGTGRPTAADCDMAEQEESKPKREREADAGEGPEQVDSLRKSVSKLKAKLDDQTSRIAALARGREEGMAAVHELRAELALVAAERDRLRRQLTDLEGMQTETQAFDEADVDIAAAPRSGELPSIDELMSSFSGDDSAVLQSHSTLAVESSSADTGEYQEMISPELIVLGSGKEKPTVSSERFLVLLETEGQSKCPLNEDLLTIGRSESADIKIDGDFISRIHARILRIGMDSVLEDAGSKNGTWVNGEQIDRHILKHGDLIRVGSGNFRFVDTGVTADTE
jgi:FHA domain